MDHAPTSARLFVEAGVLLFGDDWQSPLARLLRMNLRTVQRIAEADRADRGYIIPNGVMDDLNDAMRDRITALRVMIDRFDAGFHPG